MANGVHLITGHQADDHISAADEAAFYAALISGENKVVANSKDLTLTPNTDTGTLVLGNCILLFSGRVVRITGATATYTKPSSSTMHSRVLVGILYTKGDNDVEDCTLTAYTSEECDVSVDVKEADAGEPSSRTIGAVTTEAFYPLFDLVVTATTAPVPANAHVYNLCNSCDNLASRIRPLETYKDTETAERQDADTAIESRVSELETWKTSATSDISGKMNKIENLTTMSISNNRSTCDVSGYDFVLIRVRAYLNNPRGYTKYMTFWASTAEEETHPMPIYYDSSNDQFVIVEIKTKTADGTMTIESDSYTMNHRTMNTWQKNTADVWVTNETIVLGVRL